jgi:hypothetical protein
MTVLAVLVLTTTNPSVRAQPLSSNSASQQDETLSLAQAGRFGRSDMDDDDDEAETWRRPAYRERQDRGDRGPSMTERRRPGLAGARG